MSSKFSCKVAEGQTDKYFGPSHSSDSIKATITSKSNSSATGSGVGGSSHSRMAVFLALTVVC